MRPEEERLNAWIDHHNEHRASMPEFSEVLEAHGDFVRGWRAASLDHTVELANHSEHFAAGHRAYFDQET